MCNVMLNMIYSMISGMVDAFQMCFGTSSDIVRCPRCSSRIGHVAQYKVARCSALHCTCERWCRDLRMGRQGVHIPDTRENYRNAPWTFTGRTGLRRRRWRPAGGERPPETGRKGEPAEGVLRQLQTMGGRMIDSVQLISFPGTRAGPRTAFR